MPTGLVVSGSSLTSRSSFFDRFQTHARNQYGIDVIMLQSGMCPNLKALLREVTRTVGSNSDDAEPKSDSRLFDYDLEALRLHHERASKKHIVVAFQDSEAFDLSTLVQAINIFQYLPITSLHSEVR